MQMPGKKVSVTSFFIGLRIEGLKNSGDAFIEKDTSCIRTDTQVLDCTASEKDGKLGRSPMWTTPVDRVGSELTLLVHDEGAGVRRRLQSSDETYVCMARTVSLRRPKGLFRVGTELVY